MNQKYFYGAVLVFLCFTAVAIKQDFAANNSKVQPYEQLQDQLGIVKTNLIHIQKTKNANNQRILALQQDISRLDDNTNALVCQMRALEKSSAGIAQKIAVMDEEIENKQHVMNRRIRAMQRMNPVSAFDFLVGAKDIMEAYKRVDMLAYICKSDQALLKEMKQKRTCVENEKDNYDQKKYELLQLTKQLQAADQVTTDKLISLYIEQKNLGADLEALEEQENMLLEASKQIELTLKNYKGDQKFRGNKLAWPVPQHYGVVSKFGMRIHPILNRAKMHTGIDVQAPFGIPVVAAEDGRVIVAEWYGSYGRTVMIEHGDGIVTLYAHNDYLRVSKGDLVKRGEVISESGSTGMSTGPHVHFEVRKYGKPVDPEKWF